MSMKLLKPGETCPCCGQPLPEGLPVKTILLLSAIAEYKTAAAAAKEADKR